jgi:hypothetical protein
MPGRGKKQLISYTQADFFDEQGKPLREFSDGDKLNIIKHILPNAETQLWIRIGRAMQSSIPVNPEEFPIPFDELPLTEAVEKAFYIIHNEDDDESRKLKLASEDSYLFLNSLQNKFKKQRMA